MSAYFILHNKRVRDAGKLARYKQAVVPLVEAYGGRYLVIGGEPKILEGAWHPNFLVLIQFPSLVQATAWYNSEDYRELKAQRLSAVDSEGILMTGLVEAGEEFALANHH